jgi:hypothetical protein
MEQQKYLYGLETDTKWEDKLPSLEEIQDQSESLVHSPAAVDQDSVMVEITTNSLTPFHHARTAFKPQTKATLGDRVSSSREFSADVPSSSFQAKSWSVFVEDNLHFYIQYSGTEAKTHAFSYPSEVGRLCLSGSGFTLVIEAAQDRLEVWRLSAEHPKIIGVIQNKAEAISTISCNDMYIAYITSDGQLAVHDIANRSTQVHKTEKCELLQMFKGMLYYGDTTRLFVSDVNEFRLHEIYKVGVVKLAATEDVVVGWCGQRLIEVWKKNFEVVWRIEVDKLYRHYQLTGDKLMQYHKGGELVIHDLKSHRTTTLIAESIGEGEKLIEMKGRQITVNGSQVFELKSNWMYKISRSLGLLYYVDVVTDIVLLTTYFNAGYYLIFALSLFLIITPNIVEVIQSPHRTLRDSLAKLLFVDHLLALVRDCRHPTYLNGSRTTGKELSRRTTIETCIESIPQTLISLYYIICTENYTALPVISLASSLLTASINTSFGLKLVKQNGFVACLLCYRFCEVLVRVMLLVLCSVYIYPFFAFVFLAASIVVHFTAYFIYYCLNKLKLEHWFYYLTSSAINSFTYVNGPKDTTKAGFLTRGSYLNSLAHLLPNSFTNFVLILLLQLLIEVDVFWVAFLWSLIGSQLTLFGVMTCYKKMLMKESLRTS